MIRKENIESLQQFRMIVENMVRSEIDQQLMQQQLDKFPSKRYRGYTIQPHLESFGWDIYDTNGNYCGHAYKLMVARQYINQQTNHETPISDTYTYKMRKHYQRREAMKQAKKDARLKKDERNIA